MELNEWEVDFWEWISRILIEASGKALLDEIFICDDAIYHGFYAWESKIVEMIKLLN